MSRQRPEAAVITSLAMGVSTAQRRWAAAANKGPGMAMPVRSAAITASITWRSTAVMETLRGGAKEVMDA